MKVRFLGLTEGSKRQNHKDWALEVVPETDFEKTFFSSLLDSSRGKQCAPKASLLWSGECLAIMVEREDFNAKA